jgi:hypothetical protein
MKPGNVKSKWADQRTRNMGLFEGTTGFNLRRRALREELHAILMHQFKRKV